METKRSTLFAKRHSSVDSKQEPSRASSTQTSRGEASWRELPWWGLSIFAIVPLIFMSVGFLLARGSLSEGPGAYATLEVTGLAPVPLGEVSDPKLLTSSGDQLLWQRSILSLAERLDAGLPFTVEAARIEEGHYEVENDRWLPIALVLVGAVFLLFAVYPMVQRSLPPGSDLRQPDVRRRFANRLLWAQGVMLVAICCLWLRVLGWSPWMLLTLLPVASFLLLRLGYARSYNHAFLPGLFFVVGVLTLWLAFTLRQPTEHPDQASEAVPAQIHFWRTVRHTKDRGGSWESNDFLLSFDYQGQRRYGSISLNAKLPAARQLRTSPTTTLTYSPQAEFPWRTAFRGFTQPRESGLWIVFTVGTIFCLVSTLIMLSALIKLLRTAKKKS